MKKHQKVYGSTTKDDANDKKADFESAVSTKHFGIAVSLKYMSNFWMAIETRLINREINLMLA